MKRFIVVIIAIFAASHCFAQEIVNNALLEAQIRYDEAVLAQKQATTEMRNEERRVADAAAQRLADCKSELQVTKHNYKAVIAEQKQRVADAKRELQSVTMRYKEESVRSKKEISAARANTKSVLAERKSQVARAKAEIARVKAETQK